MHGARHPMEILEDFEESFSINSKISKTTSKRELKSIKELFKRKNDRMKAIWDRAMKLHEISGEEADSFKTEFQAVRKDLCLKLLTPEFFSRYSDQFERVTGSRDFFKLLEQIIGTVTDTDIKNEAKQKLREISRRANEEETFTMFYERIDFLAEQASESKYDLKMYLLNESFNSNLSPEIKRYLVDHDQSNGTAKEKAAFLDKREKFKKKIEINAVSVTDILKDQMEALTSQLSQQFNDLRNEIYEIKKVSAESKARENKHIYEQRRHIEDTANFFKQQETKPRRENRERCRKCGFFNHKTEECRGTSTRKCYICEETGHLSAVCPLKKTLLSKN